MWAFWDPTARARQLQFFLLQALLLASTLARALDTLYRESLAAALAQTKQEPVHFVLTMTISPPGVTMRMEGDFAPPDRTAGTVEVDGTRSEFVAIGGEIYTRDLPDGQWEKAALRRPAWLLQPSVDPPAGEGLDPALAWELGEEWAAKGFSVDRLRNDATAFCATITGFAGTSPGLQRLPRSDEGRRIPSRHL